MLGLLLLAFAFGVAGCGGSASRSPSAPEGSASDNETRAVPSVPVEFRAADGRRLRGRAYGGGERWVILVHDEGQDARAWSGITGDLSAQGFRALAFDLSGHGASDGSPSPSRMRGDISAALGFARSQGARRLYVIAAGAGASAALVAASDYPAVQALIALSPRPSLPGGSRSVLPETRAPKLIIVGSLDERASENADAVFRRSIGWTVVTSTPVRDQGTDLLGSAWGDQVRERIVAFLRDYFFATGVS
jgi:pimeloyl-ACP methyl ester carboxylesterase